MRRLLATLAALVMAVGVATVSTAPAQAATSGFNDWTCRPSAAHPHPVVVVHGTFGDSQNLLQRLEGSLVSRGLLRLRPRLRQPRDRPDRGLRRPAEDLRRQGARRHGRLEGVDGRALPGRDDAALLHQVPRRRGQGRRPRRPLAVQPRHLEPAAADARAELPVPLVPAAEDRVAVPAAPQRRRRDARATSSYTNIVTSHDEVVLPYTSGYLTGRPLTNIRLQDKCPFDVSDHLLIPSSGPAIRLVLNALGRPGPADPAYRPSCLP